MGTRIARKHVGWYLQTQPESKSFRKTFNQLETPSEQQEAIQLYFQQLLRTGSIAA